MPKQKPDASFKPLRDWHPKKGDEFLTIFGETVHVKGFYNQKFGKSWYSTFYQIRFIGRDSHEVELETEGYQKVRRKRPN